MVLFVQKCYFRSKETNIEHSDKNIQLYHILLGASCSIIIIN